jgi:hypothetical protein
MGQDGRRRMRERRFLAACAIAWSRRSAEIH